MKKHFKRAVSFAVSVVLTTACLGLFTVSTVNAGMVYPLPQGVIRVHVPQNVSTAPPVTGGGPVTAAMSAANCAPTSVNNNQGPQMSATAAGGSSYYIEPSGNSTPYKSVTFTLDNVTAGVYYLDYYYRGMGESSAASDRYLDIEVNGAAKVRVDSPRNGSGTASRIFCAEPLQIRLNAGANTIRFSCDGWYAARLNCFDLVPASFVEDPKVYPVSGAALADGAVLTGGDRVENLQGSSGTGSAVFGVRVPEPGEYKVIVHMSNNSSNRYLKVSINGGTAAELPVLNTGGSRDTQEYSATLEQGLNRVTLTSGLASGAPTLYAVEIKSVVKDPPPEYERYTLMAVNGTRSGGASLQNGYVGDIGGSNRGTVTFNNADPGDGAGQYLLTVFYCSNDPRPIQVSVNGSVITGASGVTCPSSGSWGLPSAPVCFPVTLNGGANTIAVTAPGTAYGVNVEKITLYKYEEALSAGDLTLYYDAKGGVYDALLGNFHVLSDVYAAAKVYETADNTDLDESFIMSCFYDVHTAVYSDYYDASFGSGRLLTVTHSGYNAAKAADLGVTSVPGMTQTLFFPDGHDYYLTDLTLDAGAGVVSSNYAAPLMVNKAKGADIRRDGDNRSLFVPFDNDKYVAFDAMPMKNSKNTSFEVAAFYDNTSRAGLVTGSVTHDVWKTGITSSGNADVSKLDKLFVYGGANSVQYTHDLCDHAKLSGATVTSPRVLVGYYGDWRDGLDDFGAANTLVVPKKTSPVTSAPFGWNSWGYLQTSLNITNSTAVSNFIANNLPELKNDEGVVYVDLDSYWDNMTDAQLKQFADTCKANGQVPGIYWAGPMVNWIGESRSVEGTNGAYTYGDITMRKHDGTKYGTELDGALPIDVTHPAVQARLEYFADKFRTAGFEYIKFDFLGHGILEGQHYDPNVKTGVQAYNYGFAKVLEAFDGFVINLSIAPIFPYQYGDGRRVSCDVFGQMYGGQGTAYMLNSLTYGFWERNIYSYPDPDHMVTRPRSGGFTRNENWSRVISGVITGGVFMSGDDFSTSNADYQNLYKEMFGNAGLMRVARMSKTFRPVEGNTGKDPSGAFVMHNAGRSYLALINTANSRQTVTVSKARAGIPSDLAQYSILQAEGTDNAADSPTAFSVSLDAYASTIIEFYNAAIAAEPVIDAQPSDVSARKNDAVTLSVAARSADGGLLSYQWYSCGADGLNETAIAGAAGASYAFTAGAAGAYYYFVRVTNTLDGSAAYADSRVAEVAVEEVSKAALDSLISEAEAALSGDELDGSTASGVAALRNELAAAIAVSEDGDATQARVDQAYEELSSALANARNSGATLICSVKSMLAKVAKLQAIPCSWDGKGALTFSTSNAAVCGVTPDGILIPMKAGIAVITIKAPNNAPVIFAVTVSA